MAVGHEEVLPAVVVKVGKARAPADEGPGGVDEAGGGGDVLEEAAPIVLVESIVVEGEVGDVEVEVAIVVVIGRRRAHTRLGIAAFEQGHGCLQRFLGEGAIALIAVEHIGTRVVGDEEILVAVAVEVAKERGEAIALVMIGDANCLGNIGEGAVAFVAIECIGCADQSAGAVHDVQAAPHPRVGSLGDEVDIKVDIVRHVEVEVSVVVVVAPCGAVLQRSSSRPASEAWSVKVPLPAFR